MPKDHDGFVVAFHLYPMLRIVGGNEFLARRGIGNCVTRRYDVLPIWAQHSHQRAPIPRLRRTDKGTGSLIGCLESLLGVDDGCGCAEERRYRQSDKSSVHCILDHKCFRANISV